MCKCEHRVRFEAVKVFKMLKIIFLLDSNLKGADSVQELSLTFLFLVFKLWEKARVFLYGRGFKIYIKSTFVSLKATKQKAALLGSAFSTVILFFSQLEI